MNMDYKTTLNLPATEFPMKAKLATREPLQLAAWNEAGLYHRIRELSKGRKRFILHDGPPYANGHIHMGTALNKVLKDIIIRSRQMTGYDAAYIPGWDCHGLPIEHNVEKELGDKKKNMSQEQIRAFCRTYAEKFIDIQREEFKRLGVMGEWDRPYLTMDYRYEAVIARECGKFVLDGSLFRSKKPIYWCTSCKTALAEAEIEYQDISSPSIYVAFPLKDDVSDGLPELDGKSVFVAIWTTTPWTLPANLAVTLHPEFVYAAVEVDNNRVLILARDLVESCMKAFGYDRYVILREFNAAILERKRCRHPFYDRESLLILGNHVTLDVGTGCVHTAPGHGREDYDIGLAYGLDVYSPVDDRGCFTEDIDFFRDQFVFKADEQIMDKLKEDGSLLAAETVDHSYPHCWRCKKPVIFRATPQWFISMDKNDLRENALKEIDRVTWIPQWGRDRIYGMIENRPDWCVSRQRDWGVPITVFHCEKCHTMVMNQAVVDHVAALFEAHGADIWFEKTAGELLPDDMTCESCGNRTFVKETDILDVWFDSGVSHAAVLEDREELRWPADLYLEGSDQHRGWFHSALLTAVGTRGGAPYRSVLTHGFVVDEKGKKMSKSLGNVVAPEEVIQRYGAEILRLWVSASDYQDDIRISENILKQLTDAYKKIRNTCKFMLSNLSDFNPKTESVAYESLLEIDRFALHRFQSVIESTLKAYGDYEFHIIYHRLYNYCTLDLSAFYLDILKDRLYTSPPKSSERRSAQTVIHTILDGMARLMAPILAFTAEEIWHYIPGSPDKSLSIHLSAMPEVNPAFIDQPLSDRWERILDVRKEVTKALETARAEKKIGHSLDAAVTLQVSASLFGELSAYADELRSIFIVSKVNLEAASASDTSTDTESVPDSQSIGIPGLVIRVAPADEEKCERCWVHDATVGRSTEHPSICGRCLESLFQMKMV